VDASLPPHLNLRMTQLHNTFTPMHYAQVFLNNTCALSCGFCMNKHVKENNAEYPWPWDVDSTHVKEATIPVFKKSVNFLISMGVKRIELGTTIGEPLQHDINDLTKMFHYLENKKEIEEYYFYTNLTSLTDKHIELFNTTSKFKIRISCYGLSKKQFKVQTGHDIYSKFIDCFRNLGKVKRKTKPLEILLAVRAKSRTKAETVGLLKLKAIIKNHYHHSVVTFEDQPNQYNWKRAADFKKLEEAGIEPNIHQTGFCHIIYTDCGVLSNGDITICAWLDVYGTSLIGNIYKDTPTEVLQNREAIINEQNNGQFKGICRNCNFYIPTRGKNREES
jgi:sulfatase maturation enzyme AslB (radical SAM superfamily)